MVIKFQYPRVSPGDHPLANDPEDSGYKIEPVPKLNMFSIPVRLPFYINNRDGRRSQRIEKRFLEWESWKLESLKTFH